MTHKAIHVGSGPGKGFLMSFVHDYLPEWEEEGVEVTRLDANPKVKPDIVHNLMKPMPDKLKEQYDLAYMSHVLEHIAWRDAPSVAKEVTTLIKPGGYFLIIVPSLEWAAKEICRGNYNLGVLMTIYGGQDDKWQFHNCGFTKAALSMLAEKIEMKVHSIRDGPTIVLANEKMFNSEQHELFMCKE